MQNGDADFRTYGLEITPTTSLDKTMVSIYAGDSMPKRKNINGLGGGAEYTQTSNHHINLSLGNHKGIWRRDFVETNSARRWGEIPILWPEDKGARTCAQNDGHDLRK